MQHRPAAQSGRFVIPRLAAIAILPASLAACEPAPQEQAGQTEIPPAAAPAPEAGTPATAQQPAAEQAVAIRVVADSVVVSPASIRPGTTAIQATNRTDVPYDVDIDGPGPDGEIESLQPGETRTVTMTLRPGDYEIETSAEEGPERERKGRLSVRE